MPAFATQRLMSYTPEQMFALVADIEKYPQFLPLCETLSIKRHYTDNQGREILIADMTCGYRTLRENFTSRVCLNRAQNEILVEYIDGPFRYLENKWLFSKHNKGCMVAFNIEYEFKSRMLGLLVGSLFDKAFRKFASAFEARAGKIYGFTPQAGAARTGMQINDLASQKR